MTLTTEGLRELINGLEDHLSKKIEVLEHRQYLLFNDVRLLTERVKELERCGYG